MQRQPGHLPAGLLHDVFRPVVVAAAGPAGDLVYPVAAKVAKIGGVAPVLVGVELGGHIPAAAPVLVADGEELELPGFGMAVLLAQLGHRTDAVERDIRSEEHTSE